MKPSGDGGEFVNEISDVVFRDGSTVFAVSQAENLVRSGG
jgi:hypothetical protein